MKGKLVPFQSAVVGDTGHMGLLGPALKCHLSHGSAVKPLDVVLKVRYTDR